MTKLLEVIVTSLADSIEAEAGGADRLELVRELSCGGLTPEVSLAKEICSAVSVPVRVMIRKSASMAISGEAELRMLRQQAVAFSQLPIDGLVVGFVVDGRIDVASLNTILSAVPEVRATFHRAFEHAGSPIAAIQTLKTIPQVDRLLNMGGPGSWAQRKLRLHHWQRQAQPEIKILAGAGVEKHIICDLMADPVIEEIHVGRAARDPEETWGVVNREKVARLKGWART